MKEITIIFLAINTISPKYKIVIFDNNNIVYEKFSQSPINKFVGQINKCYKILFIYNLNCYQTSLIILKNYNLPYYFYAKSLKHLILINIFDKHYLNLPIERGKIILWQNNIQ